MSPAGRPHSGPRLLEIDGQALGDEAQRHAEEYLHSLALRLGQQIRVEERGTPQLAFAVRVLTGYAQRGGELDAPVSEYLQSICEPLWIRPIDGGGYSTPEVDAALSGDLEDLADDLQGRLCLVMVAAIGREAIHMGRRVSVAQLAALIGRTPGYVRVLGHEDRIRLSGDPLTCTAKEARRVTGERR